MCNSACLDFGKDATEETDVKGKRVIEVGSRDVNGSFRQITQPFGPAEYIGVDIEAGPGVDVVCNVYELTKQFGPQSFDLVVSTEMIEHVKDWQAAISQMKSILRPGGVILLTTRSKGFPYHDYPSDYWRFEIDDMKTIFADMTIESVEADRSEPGVFVKARKPEHFNEANLADHSLYSIISDRRSKEISSFDMTKFKLKRFFKR